MRSRWLVLAGIAVAGCRADSGTTIYAAASLTAAFREMGDTLRSRHPEFSPRFNFAGSQILALQIVQGAQADVFAPADSVWMRVVQDSGLVEGEPVVFARNRLVVVLPADNPAHIRSLPDLARDGVKLVLAAASVPAGRYARNLFQQLERQTGFPPGYAGRVLTNVVSNEESVTGVLVKVRLGEADAGIVYRSDVIGDRVGVTILPVPESVDATAAYPVALLRGAAGNPGARAFRELVMSPAGQRILSANGFTAAVP